MPGYRSILLHAKRADFSVTFSRCRTKFHLDEGIWSRPDSRLWIVILFFEKVRFENDLIFLYLMDAEYLQFFI